MFNLIATSDSGPIRLILFCVGFAASLFPESPESCMKSKYEKWLKNYNIKYIVFQNSIVKNEKTTQYRPENGIDAKKKLLTYFIWVRDWEFADREVQ